MQGQYPGDRSGVFGQDGFTLTGTPTWTVTAGSVPTYPWFYSMLPLPPGDEPANAPGLTLHLAAGDSIALGAAEDWYYQHYDDLTVGYWMLRRTGGGTLEVADGYDEGFYYPSENPGVPWVWTARAAAGSDGQFTYYAADPTLLDQSHLMDDGFPLLRLTCTSGTVDITYAALRVNQVQGYFDAVIDGGEPVTTYSLTYPESYREPPNLGTHTYATTTVGSEEYFTVDDSMVLHPDVDGVTGYSTWWQGASEDEGSAEDALDAANADFQVLGGLPGPEASVTLRDEGGWRSTVAEKVSFASAPTMSTLDDVTPPGVDELELWESAGYEWMDDNTELLGWTVLGVDPYYDTQNYVGARGDADEVTYSVILSASGGEDLTTTWFATGAGIPILVESFTDTFDGTVDPGGIPDGPVLIPIDDTFTATTDRLIYARLELARRYDHTIIDQFTAANGYSAGNEGTGVYTTSRTPDGGNLGGGRIAARFRIPAWRYRIPVFQQGWPFVTKLRQNQRGDGLGRSPRRARGHQSRQASNRQRDYR